MMSQIRYQVFVSSTYDDLREERQQATQAILEAGYFPSGMELFPASDDTQWELIKRVIEESDYYVVIVAARYGSLGPEGAATLRWNMTMLLKGVSLSLGLEDYARMMPGGGRRIDGNRSKRG